MLRITMFSTADKIKGQGVGSAYGELLSLLDSYFPNEFSVKTNDYSPSDISHYHTINLLFFFSTFFKKSRGVKVGYVHFLPETLKGSIRLFLPFQKIFNAYVIRFYRRMDQLIVVNPSFIEKLTELGCDQDRITYIPNVVSDELFFEKTDVTKAALKQQLGFENEGFTVLGVGQVQERKGIDDFVRLAEKNPEIQFVWVGGFSFGKLTDGYEKYKNLMTSGPKNLTFTDIIPRSQLVDYYNMADLFLLPSYSELFPMSILEAFNCATPVLLRDLELYEAVIDGYFLKGKGLNEMDQVIKEVSQHPEILENYQEKSRQAAAVYSEEAVSKLWYRYYSDLVTVEKRQTQV
ncbi:glycosyltransferase family 4 protein [uncultured Vagococcus sp.]|uniref:glycosyltransferase family 4 protein n=1 Tax=uncultured Vagococcus sp. TaxID=189676 RepID=UPI0028D2A284|nr:glycosyltransferase family 4 protein [uncultured Vagococcus sp.]